MVFLILPGNSRRKPFRELYLDRYLNCFQTAPARDGDFCAQVAAQLNFYTLAANASIDNHGFDQGQAMPVKLQTVRIRGHRTKSLIISGDVAVSKRSRVLESVPGAIATGYPAP